MPRLPVVGSDDGVWGDYLNTFLEVSLDNTNVDEGERGKLKSTAVDAAGAVMNSDTSTAGMSFVVDEDAMTSDSATKVPTQQSVKAYVDSGTATISGKSISLASNTLTGTTAQFNTALTDNDFATLAGSETLTNKTLTSPVLNTGVSGTAVDTDGTLAANSDTKLASQKATKTYTDSKVAQSHLAGSVGYRTSGLDSWFTALAAATAASPIDVVCITDSLGDLGTTNNPAWPQLVERIINEQLGASIANYLPWAVHAGGVSTDTATATSTQGSTNATALAGYGSTLTDTQVLTHTASVTGWQVAYRTDPSYGTMTIRDGAGGTVLATINCAATAKSGNVWTSGSLTDASHTLHITSSGTTCPELIRPLRGHKVRIWPVGHSGYTSSQFTSNAYLALDLIDTLNTAGTLKLVIVATGANDTTYSTEVPALISAVQAKTSASIALWFPYLSNAFPLSEYTNARTAAYATGLPIIDSSMVAANAAGFDGTHPDVWQRKILATHVASVIGGNPIGTLITQSLSTPLNWATYSSGAAYAELGPISSTYASLMGTSGVGFGFSDGTTLIPDTNIARESAARLTINKGAGELVAARKNNANTSTSYTLVLTDQSKTIECNNASAQTVTVPPNSSVAFPTGSLVFITQYGAGQVTVAPGSGVTLRSLDSVLSTNGQYSSLMLHKRDTNEWIVSAVSAKAYDSSISAKVTGPASATDNAVALFDGTTGKLVKDSTKTLPTGTIVGSSDTQTLTNKTLDNTSTITVKDANFTLQDDSDTTKQAKFQLSGITTATTRTLTVPDANTTLVGTDATQTLTNKTLTSPVINNPSGFLSGAAKITVSSTPPSSPSSGDIWIDTT